MNCKTFCFSSLYYSGILSKTVKATIHLCDLGCARGSPSAKRSTQLQEAAAQSMQTPPPEGPTPKDDGTGPAELPSQLQTKKSDIKKNNLTHNTRSSKKKNYPEVLIAFRVYKNL